MLKLTLIEFIFRGIPEAFILIFAGYAFAGKKPEKNKFFITSILLAVAAYLVRMLPIHFGVHTIILLVIYVLVSVNINKIDTFKAISAGLSGAIILFLCEWINVFMLTEVLKINIDIAFKSYLKKCLYLSPSLILFAAVIMVVFYVNCSRRKVTKNVFGGKTFK